MGGLFAGGNSGGGGGGAGLHGGGTTTGGAGGSNFTRIRSTTRSTMAKATAVRVSTGKKFSQLLIITPAVAIDSNENDDYNGPFNSSSLDSGCGGSSEGSLSDDPVVGDDRGAGGSRPDRRNNNGTAGTRLLPLLGLRTGGGGTGHASQGSSAAPGWRWCGLICSAVKCFRAAAAATATGGRQQQSRQPLTGTTVRYTSAAEDSRGASGGEPLTRPRGGRRSGATRFSSNHVYEYTIKSYHHPQRERRGANGGGGSSGMLSSSSAGRSASVSSDSSLGGATAYHDHINNNNNGGNHGSSGSTTNNSNGNMLMSSTLLPGSGSGGGAIVVTTAMLSDTETPSPTVETARANERNNVMYKL